MPKKRSLTGIALVDAIIEYRERKNEYEEGLEDLKKHRQPELLTALRVADPDDKGLVIDEEAKEAVFYQQNSAQEFWDVEKIMTWLSRQDRQTRMAVTSRVFDPMKWEAEVAAGNIPKKIAQKMKGKKDAPAPFLRFGKMKDDSVR